MDSACFWSRTQFVINKNTKIFFVTRKPTSWKCDIPVFGFYKKENKTNKSQFLTNFAVNHITIATIFIVTIFSYKNVSPNARKYFYYTVSIRWSLETRNHKKQLAERSQQILANYMNTGELSSCYDNFFWGFPNLFDKVIS